MLGPALVWVIVWEPEVAVGVAVPEPAVRVEGRGFDMVDVYCSVWSGFVTERGIVVLAQGFVRRACQV